MAVEITVDELDAFLGDTKTVLKQMGQLALSIQQRHFREQAFDGVPWEKRYPNQSEPFFNVAGAVSDFNFGNTRPHERRFKNTPVLGGPSGQMARDLAVRHVDENSAEIGIGGPSAEYADTHNQGGFSEVALNDSGQKKAKAWLSRVENETERRVYEQRLGKLLEGETRVTDVVQRQFLGLSKKERGEIVTDVIIGMIRGGRRGDR